jgi:uncharacterized protein
MLPEKNVLTLLKNLQPQLNEGNYVFCSIKTLEHIVISDILFLFKETESITIVLKKEIADKLNLHYNFIASWITLTVHSSLEAVGLTAAFSNALVANNISCNVVAAFHHDHIFVPYNDAENALCVLQKLTE